MTRIFLSSLALIFTFIGLTQSIVRAHAQDVTIVVSKDSRKDQQTALSKPPYRGVRPTVDVAILLDTSNSMDGLIGQAKSQLWNIVQQFADAKKAGKTPSLRVSVFEYGNTKLPASEDYIRQVVPLTNDLDRVSEALFGLQTDGGDEYCGAVIEQAIRRLDWSGEPNGYKAIFIAGNEPFGQGMVDYKKSCQSAIANGIVVNTIHCGEYEVGVSTGWKQGADLAEGSYMNINQDRKVVHIDCPQDEIIIKLNSELNKTYLWYGSKERRDSYAENQIAQDNNALRQSGRSGFGGGRGIAKASSLYRNTGRDLVDSAEEDTSILQKLKSDELPEEMKNMTAAERTAHVTQMAEKRADIKQRIGQLSREREAFITRHREQSALHADDDTLGNAIGNVVRQQLQNSGFELIER